MPDDTLSRLLGASVLVTRLPAAGRRLEIEADNETREAIAARLGILGVDRFSAAADLERFPGGIRVRATVHAEVRQECVVSLQPVAETIDETVDRVFLPRSDASADPHRAADDFVDPEAEDEPDWFRGEHLDLAPLLVEATSLALDPYPRAPGAALDPAAGDPDLDDPSPFAPLARLKGLLGR